MQRDTPFKIGAVLFPGFELLDLYGPLEMFGLLRGEVAITMLAEQVGEVASNQGPKGVADKSLLEAGFYDLVLVPGGSGTRKEVGNTVLLAGLKARAAEAAYFASVCTGSALLARAGLLDGRRATSNKRAFDWVCSQGPRVKWIRKARWVADGPVFTSSGVSAGMDMALAIIETVFGGERSEEIARQAEYCWNRDPGEDPFAS